MGEESLITEELKSKVGVGGESLVCEIDEGMIRRFSAAVGDSVPLRQTVAPPAFIPTIGYGQFMQQMEALLGAGAIHGSTVLECYRPVRAGDVITVLTKIADVRERRNGTMGRVVFLTFDITYKNQRQELVAKCHQKIIGY
jgi:acyl dehydratase